MNILATQLSKWIVFAGILLIANASIAASLVDANFQYNQKQHAVAGQSQLGHLYRGFLARSMYSRCHWFPSDSQYMKLATAKCGPLIGAFLAISRFMTESNVADIDNKVVDDHGRIRFVDFKINCDIF